jgi:hypothetical protein
MSVRVDKRKEIQCSPDNSLLAVKCCTANFCPTQSRGFEVPYAKAVEKCKRVGKRLCTMKELKHCSFLSNVREGPTWSSDSCGGKLNL